MGVSAPTEQVFSPAACRDGSADSDRPRSAGAARCSQACAAPRHARDGRSAGCLRRVGAALMSTGCGCAAAMSGLAAALLAAVPAASRLPSLAQGTPRCRALRREASHVSVRGVTQWHTVCRSSAWHGEPVATKLRAEPRQTESIGRSAPHERGCP
jgi:hypothetical protein